MYFHPRRFVIVVALTLLAAAANASTLVARYEFDDGDGSDSSGKSNHLAPYGTLVYGAPASGRTGLAKDRAVLFDGSTSYFEIASSASLEIGGDITVMGWVRGVDQSSGALGRIVSKKSNPEAKAGFELSVQFGSGDGTANQLQLNSSGNGANRALNVPKDIDNAWHHVAATIQGRKGRIFLDGVEAHKIDNINPLVADKAPLRIGRTAAGSPIDAFTGWLDDVRIYSGALSSKEIREAAGVRVWVGQGNNDNWTNPTNWLDQKVPVSGAGNTAVFQGTKRLTPENDIDNASIAQIKILEGGFNIHGKPVTLTSGTPIDFNQLKESKPATLNLAMHFPQTASIFVSSGNASLTIGSGAALFSTTNIVFRLDAPCFCLAPIFGPGGLIKDAMSLVGENIGGNAPLILSSPENAYAGATAVNTGLLKLATAEALPNGTTVKLSAKTTLDLAGSTETVAGVSGAGKVTSSIEGAPALLISAGTTPKEFTGTLENGVAFSTPNLRKAQVEVKEPAVAEKRDPPAELPPVLTAPAPAVRPADPKTGGAATALGALPPLEKLDSWQQSLDALENSGVPQYWTFLGPLFDQRRALYENKHGFEPERTDNWSTPMTGPNGVEFNAVRWTRPQNEDGSYVDVSDICGNQGSCLIYGRADIDWPVSGPALIWYSNPEPEVIYFNNDETFKEPSSKRGSSRRTAMTAIPVEMKRGRNTIKLKLSHEGSRAWGFSLRIERDDSDYRLHVLNRLLSNYPGEAKSWRSAEAHLEIARRLESLSPENAEAAYQKAKEAFAADPEIQIQANAGLSRVKEKRGPSEDTANKAWKTLERNVRELFREGNIETADERLLEFCASHAFNDACGSALMYRAGLRQDIGMSISARRYYERAAREFPENKLVRGSADAGVAYSREFKPPKQLINANSDVQLAIDGLRRQLAGGVGDEAETFAKKLTEISRLHGDALLRVSDSPFYPRFAGAREYVRAMIEQLDAPALAAYQRVVAKASGDAFALAKALNNPSQLEAVALEYPFTPAALRALNDAGNLLLDRGAYTQAAHALQALSEQQKRLGVEPAGLSAAKLAFSQLNESAEMAAPALEQLRKSTQPVLFAGSPCNGAELAARFTKTRAGSGEQTFTQMYAGNPLRTGVALPSPAPRPGALAWQQALNNSRSHTRAREQFGCQFSCLQSFPVLAGKRAFVTTLEGVMAVDAASGAILWRQDWGSEGKLAPDEFNGFPLSCPAYANGLLYMRATQQSYTSMLRCYNAENGRPVWTKNIPGTIWLSDPLITGGQAVAPFLEIGRDEQSRADTSGVAAFDALTGRPLWKTVIGVGRAGVTMDSRGQCAFSLHLGPPSCDGGVIYTQTGMGSVAALNAYSGGVIWISGYPRADGSRKSGVLEEDHAQRIAKLAARGPASPILTGSLVLVAPKDAFGIFALDRESGEIRWQRDICDARFIAGVFQNRLLVADHCVRALDIKSGESAWEYEIKGHGLWGQPGFSGGYLYLPTHEGLQVINAASGQHAVTAAWDQRVGPLGSLIISEDAVIGANSQFFGALKVNGQLDR